MRVQIALRLATARAHELCVLAQTCAAKRRSRPATKPGSKEAAQKVCRRCSSEAARSARQLPVKLRKRRNLSMSAVRLVKDATDDGDRPPVRTVHGQ